MRKRACVALVTALIVLLAVDAGCSPRGNPWTVVTVRELRPSSGGGLSGEPGNSAHMASKDACPARNVAGRGHRSSSHTHIFFQG